MLLSRVNLEPIQMLPSGIAGRGLGFGVWGLGFEGQTSSRRALGVGLTPYTPTLHVLLHEVSTPRPHPNPPPLGDGAGLLPPTGGGWEGGICANLTKQYTSTLHPAPQTLCSG